MRKYLSILAIVLAVAAARATWVYNSYLINGLVAYTQNYVLNLSTTPNASGIARLSAQAVYSSATLPTDTFTDGRVSTATITVASNSGLVAAAATNKITIAANSAIQAAAATDTLVVNSTNGLTGASVNVAGTTIVNNGWRVDLASHTASDIAAQANTYVNQIAATTGNTETVTFTAKQTGTLGNAYTLSTSTPTALVAGAATFSGGKDPAFRNQSITINGMVYPRGYYWNLPNDGILTSTGTAVSIAALLNTITGIQANAAGSVVYATATVAGVSGNLFTIVSSTPSAMTVLTPTFTGGASAATVTINGTAVSVSTGASTTLTAANIASAINANSSLSSIVVATNTANVVFTTSTAVGTLTTYTLTTSTPTALVPSHATYVGGQNSAFTRGSPLLYIPAHGYSTGVPLLLTGSAPPAPLSANTTYYSIFVDANDIKLATSQSNAIAGTPITYTVSITTGPHTTTLTPLAIAGSLGLQWQVSNDCVNYSNYTTTSLGVAVSSLTLGSPYTAGSTIWDLGPVNYQCIQAAVVGPTAGAINLQVKLNGSNP